LAAPIVGGAALIGGEGYYEVGSDGGIFAFGDAQFYGSVPGVLKPGQKLNSPIVGIASSPDGAGYWLVAADGGIFSFGDAPFYGSAAGSPIAAPIVGMTTVPAPFQTVSSMVAMPDDKGYFQTDIGGDVYTYGDAQVDGSPGNTVIPDPIFSMATTADGGG
jgi:hypothetical protein